MTEETKELAIADIAKFANLHKDLECEISRLMRINEQDKKEHEERFTKLKTIAIQGIEASKLILTVITKSETAHWQKKENIRNAIGVLEILQTRIAKADPIPLPFDDDF
ncbi:hypothetical protein [Pseudanabaena sp. 'Roaring Creek']|uniref:hypothetical protein n=1 Tax=Pseudanabaena sp. 'Roaring Creek' TaxID=1681830 RepID=UPI0006D76B9E|nr:hypothetical protein [Pseudanabaena sp. 'Roaring Creek']